MELQKVGLDYIVYCDTEAELSPENVLKNISVMKGKLMSDCTYGVVNRIVCEMTPLVKENIVKASKRLKMYGKSQPIVHRFDEYMRPLDDELMIDPPNGMTINIKNPKLCGDFYLSLRAVNCFEEGDIMPKQKKDTTLTYEDLSGNIKKLKELSDSYNKI